MKIPSYILAKFLKVFTIVVILWFLFFLPNEIFAAPIESNVVTQVYIYQDLSTKIIYEFNIKNNSNQVLSEFEIKLPFFQVISINAKVSERRVKSTQSVHKNYTLIQVQLARDSIRPSKRRKIRLTIEANGLIQTTSYYKKLFLPKVSGDYSIEEMRYQITYPETFQKLQYIPSSIFSVENNVLNFSSNNDIVIVWGDDTVRYSLKRSFTPVTSDETILFNLPTDLLSQKVKYSFVVGVENVGVDNTNTHWGFVNARDEVEVSYIANIESKRDRGNLPSHNLNKCMDINWEGTFPEKFTDAEKVQVLYKYLIDTFGVNEEVVTQIAKSLENKPTLTNIEFSCALQSYLVSIGINSVVSYGYDVVDFTSFSTELGLPTSWVETVIDGNVIALDPYHEKVSGNTGYDLPLQFKLLMGVYSPHKEYDNVLGLNAGNLAYGGKLGEYNEIEKMGELTIRYNFPDHVISGEFFSGTLSVFNPTHEVMKLSGLNLDGEEVKYRFLFLYKDIEQSLLPVQTTRINLDFLREPNFLRDEEVSHLLELTVDSELIPSQSIVYTINYLADKRLLWGIAFISSSLGIILFILLIRMYLKRRKIMKKSFEQVYATQR